LQINIASDSFSKNDIAKELVDFIESHQTSLSLEDSILYYEFPLFKEVNEEILYPKFKIVSPYYGIVIIQSDSRTHRTASNSEINKLYEFTDQLNSYIYAKLIKILFIYIFLMLNQ